MEIIFHFQWLQYQKLWSQIIQVSYEKGYGEKDTVAFYEVLRGMAGLEERPGIDNVPMGKDE